MHEGLIEQARKVAALEGWEALDEDHPERVKYRNMAAAEMESINQAVHECLSSPAGKVMMDFLIDQTLFRAIVTPDGSQFDAGIKEGRADLVRELLFRQAAGAKL